MQSFGQNQKSDDCQFVICPEYQVSQLDSWSFSKRSNGSKEWYRVLGEKWLDIQYLSLRKFWHKVYPGYRGFKKPRLPRPLMQALLIHVVDVFMRDLKKILHHSGRMFLSETESSSSTSESITFCVLSRTGTVELMIKSWCSTYIEVFGCNMWQIWLQVNNEVRKF